MYSYGPPHMAGQKQDDQHEHTFSRYVRIWNVTLKTCQRRWMIGESGERGSGISVLVARHDDDDNINYKQILFFFLFLGFYPRSPMDMMRCDYICDCFYEIMHDYMRYYHWKNGRFRVSQSFLQFAILSWKKSDFLSIYLSIYLNLFISIYQPS